MYFLLLLSTGSALAQDIPFMTHDHPLYQLEERLMDGDKSALIEIAPYFDSQKEVIEFLGYHQLHTKESAFAKRIVIENSLFTDEEFRITDTSTSKQFLNFLDKYNDKIVFSDLATSFLITPLEQRPVNFEIRAVSEKSMQELHNNVKDFLYTEWVWDNNIDVLIKQKDPTSLLIIASELFKIRSRFDRYYFYEEEFIHLLQYLTGTDIGVENEKGLISWHIDEDYYPESKLNLLIYFSHFYTKYSWDEKRSIFVRPDHKIRPLEREEMLFPLLDNKNDSIALDAFKQLTVCDPEKVAALADEYESANIHSNFAIPIFPYRFLKQLVLLTAYCKANEIDFNGTEELKNDIALLQKKLSFSERRKCEDRLIRTLTLDNITAFEYWALLYEQSTGVTYSAGRILDVFYSEHFNEILNDDRQLTLFLKKTALFDDLGIIGICNNYSVKFTNLQEYGIERLDALQSTDILILHQIERAKFICKQALTIPNDTMKISDANMDFAVKNIRQEIRVIRNISDQEAMEDSLTELLSKINYGQIGEAIERIEDIKFEEYKWKKYSFLERDFGFFMYWNFDKEATRSEFLADYKKFSEFNFYKNMLMKSGLDYFKDDGSLSYDKIYDALKYNVVVAFAGGGGGRDDNEVYAVIKLLELTHNTTLGYPKKLCNSDGIYGCDSQDRADYWMLYLRENGLLEHEHAQPVSFHYK